ncbi:zinc ribbon domain-containing protein [Paenibacillus jiagnxiensis]|uniref:zinc ribbon domain-containing protein n=1 Tax=Paenibacillus jiagnxiensis TaxID=3228926 RepID=UPI0033A96824
MKNCNNCGKEILNQQAKFCPSCGHRVESHAQMTEHNELTKKEQVIESAKDRTEPKKGIKNLIQKNRLLLILVLGLIVILSVSFKVGSNLMSKDRLINRFEVAVREDKPEALKNLLSSSDDRLIINDKGVQGFLTYLNQHPNVEERVVENLKIQANSGEIDWYTQNEMVNLYKDGKFLFFDRYKLEVQPAFLTVETNYPNVQLYANGEEIATIAKANSEQTVGPFLPGQYEIEAKLKNDFVELSRKEEVALIQDTEAVTLDLDGENVKFDIAIRSDYAIEGVKGDLLINGKSVGINPLQEETYGPLLTNGSLTASFEGDFPWGKVKTADVPIDSSRVVINPTNEEKFQQAIMEQVTKNFNEYMEAYTTGNIEKLTIATDNYKNQVKGGIDSDKFWGNRYSGKYIGTTFDLSSFYLSNINNQWTLRLDVSNKFNEDSTFRKGEKPELKEENHVYNVTLVYDTNNSKWLVDAVYNKYWKLDSENTKEVVQDNPKTYTSSW